MNILPAIANSVWLAASLPDALQFRRALLRPADTQLRLLRNYLDRNANTAYGCACHFGTIKSYDDFKRQVPLNDYDDFKPWIARIQKGEKQILTADPVTHLVPTSGSSGARKLIPFTATLQREFGRGLGAWITDLYRRHVSVVRGTAYWSISPDVPLENETSAVPVGFDDDSAYLGGAKKRLVNAVLAAPSELRLVPDVEQFRYLTLLCLLRRTDLSLISVWHPSFLSLLLDAMPKFWDELLADIASGNCRYSKSCPPAVLSALHLRPWPQRAKELEAANPLNPASLWPRLKIISCWGDAHAKLGKADLQRHFPSAFIQSKGLLATECFVTLPFAGRYPLAVTSHFFEFLDERGQIFLAHELKKNGIYEVVVTTGGGLWRYRLRDQVKVVDCCGETPSLQFLGRAETISDRCGEKLSEPFVAEAIRLATIHLSSPPRFALLAPDENDSGCGYTLYVEGDVPVEIGTRLEESLCANFQYAWCRKLGQLRHLRIFTIENRGYETFITRQQRDGKRMGDIKPVALSKEANWSRLFHGRYLF